MNIKYNLVSIFKEYEEKNKINIFKKNINKSIYYLLENTFFIFILYYVCYKVKINPKIINNNFILQSIIIYVCLFLIGVLFWGQFVLGHDMGHESFSDNNYINKILGIITHGSILVPFQQWRCSHRKHHKNTGHIDNDEIFKPIKKNCLFFNFISQNLTTFPYIWISYLFFGYPDEHNNHFELNYILAENKTEKIMCYLSTIYIIFFLYFLFKLGKKIGYKNILIFYFIPWTIFNYLIVMVTFLQHQNKKINWKNDKSGWTSEYGALQSVNRSYGPIFDYLTRNIGPYHQMHHMFPKIPHYNLKNAHHVFKKRYPHLVNNGNDIGLLNQFKEYLVLSKIWKKNIINKDNVHNFYK